MSTEAHEARPVIGIDDEQRQVLARLADVLIPKADGMPSASEVGVAGRWLDEVLRLRPDFVSPLAAVLDRFRSVDDDVDVADLQATDPDGFFVLTEVVAGGYFLDPDVRAAIGYPGQQRVPIVSEEPRDYEQDGLLDAVIARGPIYRPTPPRMASPAVGGRAEPE